MSWSKVLLVALLIDATSIAETHAQGMALTVPRAPVPAAELAQTPPKRGPFEPTNERPVPAGRLPNQKIGPKREPRTVHDICIGC
ncbi:hypothetical protein FV232_00935 [Methylobacterium sp. WL30]|nr:hypothetical protein FV225_11665 [Methylobacterium sp. WL93]TXN52267.1 hypothetical protein FV227_04235 [Methylobacterium sp. WL119]TXN70650.1 hypothetical protein FV232_00935 [Methylobacterium sp. WL30]